MIDIVFYYSSGPIQIGKRTLLVSIQHRTKLIHEEPNSLDCPCLHDKEQDVQNRRGTIKYFSKIVTVCRWKSCNSMSNANVCVNCILCALSPPPPPCGESQTPHAGGYHTASTRDGRTHAKSRRLKFIQYNAFDCKYPRSTYNCCSVWNKIWTHD